MIALAEDYEPCPSYEREVASLQRGSQALAHAIGIEAGRMWVCGHHRTPETTHRCGNVVECKRCRRARWTRGFRIAVLRRRTRLAFCEAAQKAHRSQREQIIRAAIEGGSGRLPLDMLIFGAATFFDLGKDDLLSKSRLPHIVRARSVVVRILRERRISYPVIARLLNRDDHSTMIHSFHKFEDYLRYDQRVAEAYQTLRDKIL